MSDQNQTKVVGNSKTERASSDLQSPLHRKRTAAGHMQMCRAPQGQERSVMTVLQRLPSQQYVVWDLFMGTRTTEIHSPVPLTSPVPSAVEVRAQLLQFCLCSP